MELLRFSDHDNDRKATAALVAPRVAAPWNILVVDDDPEVHGVTRLVLKGFEYDGRPLRILSAHDSIEAKRFLTEEKDLALILLDVVMERDMAGLDLARYIREDLKNYDIRIVLRTGQPGIAPEDSVIRAYDINDYKSKTELTATKLNTLLYSALRTYRDICLLNNHRRGLERMIEALSEVAQARAIPNFASAVLDQLTNLISLGDAQYWNVLTAFAEVKDSPNYRLLAMSGKGIERANPALWSNEVSPELDAKLRRAFDTKQSHADGSDYVGFFRTTRGSENLLYLSECGPLSPINLKLLELYCANVAVAYENLLLHEEIEESQRELIFVLGEAVEQRSKETGGHLKRVAAIAEMLARDYGLNAQEVELIRYAAPLHDVGKVGIPDVVLNKPGKHTDAEWTVMKTHTSLGFRMLNKSDKRILKRGALIALQHHEKWDGSGYPAGLSGENIDVSARITALADVFDALGSERCYKSPWETQAIVDFIERGRGTHFEPRLVELLFSRLPDYLQLREIFPD